jgi:hypothetical protein
MLPLSRNRTFPLIAALSLPLGVCVAQQPDEHPVQPPTEEPIARTSATTIKVEGAMDMHRGEMLLGNGSTVTAGSQPVAITLTRGGELLLCSTTSLHLAKDPSISDPASTALMMALDRGALEANYTVGKYSDVLLTPDLRILISGPGEAALSIRVNAQGDTCLDNHGANAPYVTVSSQLEDGLYRVLPNQRVSFEHGSIGEVVDHETELCGCPAPEPLAPPILSKNQPGTQPGQPAGGPSSATADTAFPIAVSEGLAAPPAPASEPVVPAGEAHAEVTVPLTYNGDQPPAAPSAPAPPAAEQTPATQATAGSQAPTTGTPRTGLLHRIGHFFSHIFGG